MEAERRRLCPPLFAHNNRLNKKNVNDRNDYIYAADINFQIKEPVPLMGRSAILGEQKDNEFCDVVCGRGAAADSTYAITRGGLLCEFNGRRLLDKWVELRVRKI